MEGLWLWFGGGLRGDGGFMNGVQSRLRLVCGVLVVVVSLGGGVARGQFSDPLGGAVDEARAGAEASRGDGGGAGDSGGPVGGVGVAVGSEEMRLRQLMERLMIQPGGEVGEAEVKARLEALADEAGVMARRLDAGPLKGAALGVRVQAMYGLVTRWPGDVLGEVRLAEMRRSARQLVAMGGVDGASVGDYWLMMAELVEINGQEGLGGAEKRVLARREMNRYLERYRSGPGVGAVRDALFALNSRIERDRAGELRKRVEVGREVELVEEVEEEAGAGGVGANPSDAIPVTDGGEGDERAVEVEDGEAEGVDGAGSVEVEAESGVEVEGVAGDD